LYGLVIASVSEWLSDWVKTVRQQESNVNCWDLKAVLSCDGTQRYGVLAQLLTARH